MPIFNTALHFHVYNKDCELCLMMHKKTHMELPAETGYREKAVKYS